MTIKRVLTLILIIAQVGLTQVRASEGGATFFSKLTEFLGTPISNFLTELDSVNIQTSKLGIDDGIIANVILGTARKVERNPHPTGDDDQFLVKDVVRMGLRLGAGLIVGGTAAYIQEWTIVYPVETRLKGVLHNKFFVNLFLPYQVWRDKLPEKYVIMSDSYLEGQARIKLGGGAVFPIGTEVSAARVKLKRTFISKKSEDKLTVFEEVGKYFHLAQSIYADISLISIPIFDGYFQKGKAKRIFKDVMWTHLDNKEQSDFMHNFIHGNKVIVDDKKQIERHVENKFMHRYSYFNLLWLMSEENHYREDLIQDKLVLDNKVIAQENIYQIEAIKKSDWTTFLEAEDTKSTVYFSAVPTLKDNDLVTSLTKPEMTITLTKRDMYTRQKEVDNIYLPLLNRITENEHFNTPFKLEKSNSKEVLFNAKLQYDSDAINILSNLTSDQIFDRFEKITGKERVYWERAARSSYHSRELSRLRNSRLTLGQIYTAKQLLSIARELKNSRLVESPQEKARKFIFAMRRSLLEGGGAFNDSIIRMFNSFIPAHMRTATATLTQWPKDKPKDGESTKALVLRRSTGTEKSFRVQNHRFYFDNNSHFYHLL